MSKKLLGVLCMCLSIVVLVGCQQGENDAAIENIADNQTVVEKEIVEEVDTINTGAIEKITAYFQADALVEDITTIDCTLSDGTETSCYKIVVTHGIDADDIGPWCPRNIADSAEQGGIWIDDGKVYDVSGEFIAQLAEFYGDAVWQLYDEETGEISVTDSKEAFEAAARPDVAEEYQNHCVEGLLSYVDGIPTEIYVIPVKPKKSTSIQQLNNQNPIGVAFNGIRFDAPAPVANILDAHTIAAFDDCGGHVNPFVGYHYHAETGCAPRIEQKDGHEGLIGFALDGFEVYEHNEDLADLDACGGHTDDIRGYHYHIAHAGDNQQLTCFSGGYGCVLSADGECDASTSEERRGPPPGQR